MLFKDCLTDGNDFLEAQLAVQKGGHGRFIGRVEHRPGRAARPGKSGGSNSRCIARLQSSFAATPTRRSGQVRAYWIGSFMSGGLI